MMWQKRVQVPAGSQPATGLMDDSTSSSLQDRRLCKGDPSPPEGTQLLSAFVFIPTTTIFTVGRGAP